jgi:hypothetical protein
MPMREVDVQRPDMSATADALSFRAACRSPATAASHVSRYNAPGLHSPHGSITRDDLRMPAKKLEFK